MSLRDTLPLESKKIVKKTIAGSVHWLFFLLFFSIQLIFGFFGGKGFGTFISYILLILALLVLVVIVGTYFYQREYFRSYFYDQKEDVLVIRKGVFAPSETNLLFKKINDVYVDQDIFDRLFGLYDVHFSTASDQSTLSAHIDGVSQENAEKLKNIVLNQIKKQTS